MAAKRIEVIGLIMTNFVVVMIMINISSKAMAQQSCMNVIISMASCLDFVSGNTKSPTPSCCSSLANVVGTQPRCLCAVLSGGGSSLGVNINQTIALQLPDACKVDTPPVSRCNETASAGPADGTSDSTSPSVTGSKATPATSSGSVTKKNINMVGLFVVVVVACASKFNNF